MPRTTDAGHGFSVSAAKFVTLHHLRQLHTHMKRHLTATLLKACLLAEISKYRYMPAAAISTMRLSSQSKEVRARSPTADLRHRSTPSPATSYASQPTPKQAPSQRPPNADNYGLRDTAISASTNPQPCPAPPTRGMVFRYLRQNS